MFRRLDLDAWLAHKVFRAGSNRLCAFPGVTNGTERREILRREILALSAADRLIPRNHDEPAETFAAAFQRIYGEALTETNRKDVA